MTEKAKYAYAITSYGTNYSTAVDKCRIIQKTLVYGIIAQEICPETKRLHIQGYFYFKRPTRFHVIQKLLPGCHIEPARKAPEANACYCQKELCYTEFGNLELAQKLYYGEVVITAINESK